MLSFPETTMAFHLLNRLPSMSNALPLRALVGKRSQQSVMKNLKLQIVDHCGCIQIQHDTLQVEYQINQLDLIRNVNMQWLRQETLIYFLQFLDIKCWETMHITMEICDLKRIRH